jgi:hypothetical protein
MAGHLLLSGVWMELLAELAQGLLVPVVLCAVYCSVHPPRPPHDMWSTLGMPRKHLQGHARHTES